MRLADECDIVDTDRYASSVHHFTFLLKYISLFSSALSSAEFFCKANLINRLFVEDN